MGDVGTFFFFRWSGCENDSLPLVSSDGVKAERLRGAQSGGGIAPNCHSSSASLPASICPPLPVRPSVRPAGSLCLRAPLSVRRAVTLRRCEPFLSLSSALPSGNAALLALQAAAARGGGVGRRRGAGLAPVPFRLSISVLPSCLSLARSPERCEAPPDWRGAQSSHPPRLVMSFCCYISLSAPTRPLAGSQRASRDCQTTVCRLGFSAGGSLG